MEIAVGLASDILRQTKVVGSLTQNIIAVSKWSGLQLAGVLRVIGPHVPLAWYCCLRPHSGQRSASIDP